MCPILISVGSAGLGNASVLGLAFSRYKGQSWALAIRFSVLLYRESSRPTDERGAARYRLKRLMAFQSHGGTFPEGHVPVKGQSPNATEPSNF